MGYPENMGEYFRARYKKRDGTYGTVKDANGVNIRFRSSREAKKAANDAEAAERAAIVPKKQQLDIKFCDYVSPWYARQDLALSTMQNYKHHIEDHLLRAFGDSIIREIERRDVDDWQLAERAAGYLDGSIKSWRSTLHLILEDAMEEGYADFNAAARRKNRGKRAGRSRHRAPEKAVTTALGILLIAERAALLSGRDDEFIAIATKGFTGMRFGELVGLEPEYVRPHGIRVEWQLYELDNGSLHRCPPKDDSYRTIFAPGFVIRLLRDHISRTKPKPCRCHELAYVFSGHRPPNGGPRGTGATLADVARLAGVSVGHASTALNYPEKASEKFRAELAAAMEELGYVPGGWVAELAAHWRRGGFGTWLFRPAATGSYQTKGRLPARPVPVFAGPWPGIPVRGRNAAERANACWLPIAAGMTPHGSRHTYKTMMDELGIPPKLKDQQMGHSDGSVQAGYSHVTDVMVQRLLEGLTELWETALAARREISPGSPVAVLDALLRKETGE